MSSAAGGCKIVGDASTSTSTNMFVANLFFTNMFVMLEP